ncbi:hypothetical protein ACMATS_06180 [Streptoverticillium reticulum]|uniref:hypothetical protein n=1 Tax=Streptoverticillium reticulum TaxID=1433415 RepID=UPI0039BF59D0
MTARRGGVEQPLGRAYQDTDLVEFMRRVGLPEDEALLDDPETVQWLDDPPHEWTAR